MWMMIRGSLLALLAALCLGLCDDGHEMEEFLKREYSLSKPYQGVGVSGSSHWELMGDALVTTDHVRLTPDRQSKQGAIWSRIPCHLRDWELQVHFKIHGQGKKNLNGDGLAVWYTKERMRKGPVFGNRDFFTGLGVFVDTYPNEEKLLEIMLDIDGQHEWRDCLDVPGVRLPQGFYFGASAITGDLSDNHDLISMKLYQLTVLRSKQEDEETEEILVPSVDNMELLRPYTDVESMSSISIFFCVLFSMLGVFLLAVVGLVLYGHWSESRRKRFY